LFYVPDDDAYATMTTRPTFPLVAIALLMSACTTDSLKRTGYETLQNINQQQCDKDFSSECPERESYEDYKRKLEQPEARPKP
jgi:hypothetical protein